MFGISRGDWNGLEVGVVKSLYSVLIVKSIFLNGNNRHRRISRDWKRGYLQIGIEVY